MFKYKKKTVEVLDEVVCDVCGCSTKIDEKAGVCEYAELRADWGYYSDGLDGESHRIHFCQKCYEKMLKLLKIAVVNIRISDSFEELTRFLKKEKNKIVSDAQQVLQKGKRKNAKN